MRNPPHLPALLMGVALAVASAVPLFPRQAAAAEPACSVRYTVTNSWDHGFQGALTLTNKGAPLSTWALTFDFPGTQKVTQGWNANWSQSARHVTATNESWNGSLGTGASTTLGFLAAWSDGNTAPSAFELDGTVCDAPPTDPSDPTDPTDPPTPPVPGPPALRVQGDRLVDSSGAPRRLTGVNRSGAEFMCVQGHGIFDGPVDDRALTAIADWKANTVRVPLNEECWLGLDNIKPEYSGVRYRDAVTALVRRIEVHGMTPVLDLHWSWGQYTGNSSGCADVHATCQKPMPDARYGPAFWTSVGETFKGDPAVVFDLFNEPYPDRATATAEQAWACWRDGGTCPGIGYEVAGMQRLLTAVRATGAKNLVLAAGLAYANDLGQWWAHRPQDPSGNLAAAWHVYNFNACATETCWDSVLTPLATHVPVVTGEIGENTCSHGFVDRVMSWLDGHGLSYLGWTWNTWDCSSGPALISSYDGTPTPYGIGVRDHLRAVPPPTGKDPR
ncbi:cellulose binding domain-containing protein [Streptomyces sp. NPDC046557]|uniref:cellulose binding domain-containing protein n=1 Tax=Streptomyces sp. NPDC046557 TaxID=3155372 RepID=UPI00340411D2